MNNQLSFWFYYKSKVKAHHWFTWIAFLVSGIYFTIVVVCNTNVEPSMALITSPVALLFPLLYFLLFVIPLLEYPPKESNE